MGSVTQTLGEVEGALLAAVGVVGGLGLLLDAIRRLYRKLRSRRETEEPSPPPPPKRARRKKRRRRRRRR